MPLLPRWLYVVRTRAVQLNSGNEQEQPWLKKISNVDGLTDDVA